MVAINPKKNLHFGENPPEIHLNSTLCLSRLNPMSIQKLDRLKYIINATANFTIQNRQFN